MIHELSSSLSTFKTLRFKPGFNLLLAEREVDATARQTRNGAGKSSVVMLLHFLLGGDAEPDHPLRVHFEGERWRLKLDLGDEAVEVERVVGKSTDVQLHGGEGLAWPKPPRVDKKTGLPTLSSADWRRALGAFFFELPEEPAGGFATKTSPTLRALLPYFLRRSSEGGMEDPALQNAKQHPWDSQCAISWLLGLNAALPVELERLRQQEKQLKGLEKLVKQDAFNDLVGDAGQLRSELILAEEAMGRLQGEVESFQVVEAYRELEQEASQLSYELADLSNANALDWEQVNRLEEALAQEVEPSRVDVERVYREAGLLLPEVVLRRYEEVEDFHASVLSNRRSHLKGELREAQHRIKRHDERKKALSARRAEIMQVLKRGGALEHFTQLQAELGRAAAQVERLRQRQEAAERLSMDSAELELQRARLLKQLNDDHHEHERLLREAIVAFSDLSRGCYEEPGRLVIAIKPSGPSFEIHIPAKRSEGIRKMQIVCFDLMLMILLARRGRGPGFLVHDSHLFDGVDERQIAAALKLGARKAEEHGFQYIVTMNDDVLPRAWLEGELDLERAIIEPRLSDATEDGGLFGCRFD